MVSQWIHVSIVNRGPGDILTELNIEGLRPNIASCRVREGTTMTSTIPPENSLRRTEILITVDDRVLCSQVLIPQQDINEHNNAFVCVGDEVFRTGKNTRKIACFDCCHQRVLAAFGSSRRESPCWQT